MKFIRASRLKIVPAHLATLLATLLAVPLSTKAAAAPFAGDWCLTSPDGGAVWLRVEVAGKTPTASMMWEVGGVEPLTKAYFQDGALMLERPADHWLMTSKGIRRKIIGVDTMRATVQGDTMDITLRRTLKDGTETPPRAMGGKRQAPLPQRPDLKRIRLGNPIRLFNERDLSGWRLTNPADNNAWSARDRKLCNDPQLEEGESPRQFGNIRTEREFEDFRLTLEVRLPKGGNSGIYLRGRYEVQVADSHGREPSWGGMGGVYSRIVPLENAAKPAGQWQHFDILLADRHITVHLNGRLVIDNQPLEGCTGGALDSDDLAPGPIYFQGDHTAVEYRNIMLFPRVK